MADKLQLLLEAEKRGILPPDKQSLLDEARRRGIMPSAPAAPPLMDQMSVPHGVSMVARSALKGLASPAYLGADLLTGAANLGIRGVNAVTGSAIPIAKLPSAGENATLSQWFGDPQGGVEKVASRANEFAASVPTMAAAAGASGVRALAPLAENIGSQLVAATTGGAASGTVNAAVPDTNRYKQWLESAAALIGGAAGGVTSAPRQAMDNAIAAFQRSGIDASAADVSQAPGIQLVQKVVAPLASDSDILPGSYVANRENTRLGQAQQAQQRVAAGYGAPTTNVAAGQAMQEGAQNYRYRPAPAGMSPSDVLRSPTHQTSIAAKADALYQRIGIAPDAAVPVPNTTRTLTDIVSRYANPDLQGAMGDPTIARWSEILNRANGQLTWSDLRNLRTDVRYIRAHPNLSATVDDRALDQLNGALTQDMRAGAFHLGGSSAEQAVTRADNYYAGAMNRVSSGLNQVFKASTPEDAYAQFERAVSSKASGDITKVNALRRALGPDGWGDLVATWLDRAGLPKASQAGIPGKPDFGVETFLTNYNNLSPLSRQAMFNGTGQSGLRQSLDDLVTALGSMRGTDRAAANTSKSAQQGIAATAGVGAVTGMAHAPVSTLAAIGAVNLTARALYNPTFIRLMATGVRATAPQMRRAFVTQASRVAQANPAIASDVQNLLKSFGLQAAATAPGAKPDSRAPSGPR